MALPKSTYISEKEYLALDLDSDIRYEYANGEIFAMAGASREHNLIASNVHVSIANQLRERDCEVYQSDMRVHTKADAAYRYPDVVVVCGEPEFTDTNPVSLINPTLIIEVLSASNTDSELKEKSSEYRDMPSVQEYVIIRQDKPHIERYYRQDTFNWLYTELTGLEQQLMLKSIDCVLDFSEVFRRINFNAENNEEIT